jgi:hypothetical protein
MLEDGGDDFIGNLQQMEDYISIQKPTAELKQCAMNKG